MKRSRLRAWLIGASGPAAALLFAALAGALVIWSLGRDPWEAYRVMVSYSFGRVDSVASILIRATPLIFSGLAVAVSFRAGLFNIGVEGQFYMGTFAASLAGIYLAGLPALLHLPLTILAGMAGGALWAWLPIYLRTRRGVHEVISTIMLNLIAASLLLFLVNDVFLDRSQFNTSGQGSPRVRMAAVAESARMPTMHGFLRLFGVALPDYTALSWFFPLSLLTAVGVYLYFWRTIRGYELRVVGHNPAVAEAAGIAARETVTRAFLLSGALAGLVGLPDLLSFFGFLDIDFPKGYGFTGIAVALLGRNHPGGIVLAALLFGFLQRGSLGLQALTNVPREMAIIVEGTVILAMAVAAVVAGRYAARLEREAMRAVEGGTPVP